MLEAPKASRVCKILAAAKEFDLPGSWFGSAYRHHPRGVIRKNMIFVNEWSTYDYCKVSVILDPSSGIEPAIDAPAAHHARSEPHPKSGGVLIVYLHGRWIEDDGPWRQAILDVLADLETEIEAAREARSAKEATKRAANEALHLAALERARASLSVA